MLQALTIAGTLAGCVGIRNESMPPPPVLKHSWAAIDALPNFWEGTWFTFEFRYDFTDPPQLTAQARVAADAYLRKQIQNLNLDTEVANCVTPGMPHVMDDGSMPIKFLPTPEGIIIYLEGYSQARFIHMDGRSHSPTVNRTFLGDSIGHWEAGTLVVDTEGVIDRTTLAVAAGVNPRAPAMLHHGSAMHIVERFRLLDPDTLEGKRWVYDESLFTAPVETTRHWRRDESQAGEVKEYVCSDNRDRFDPATGKLHSGEID